jgi:hypothetical protein
VIAGFPPPARELIANAASQGFLDGLNNILLMGAALSFIGALLAWWLIRERDIRRDPPTPRLNTGRPHGAQQGVGAQLAPSPQICE